MNCARSVHADSHAHAMLLKHPYPFPINQCSIGLNSEGHRGVGQGLPCLRAPGIELPGADQTRLSAVKGDEHAPLPRKQTMLPDSLDSYRKDLIRHQSRLLFPGRIRLVVDIAIRTTQIAPGCHLQDHLRDTRIHTPRARRLPRSTIHHCRRKSSASAPRRHPRLAIVEGWFNTYRMDSSPYDQPQGRIEL